jgi:hypothetical protein
MKGTLDPVEAMFSAVSGLWGRIVTFLAVCWAGYVIGILAGATVWDQTHGLRMDYPPEVWYLNAGSWIMESLSSAMHELGPFRLLFLVVMALAQFFTGVNLCRMSCLLLLEESWFWWSIGGQAFDYYDYSSHAPVLWHPLFPVMILLTIAAMWLWWRSWRNDRPATS